MRHRTLILAAVLPLLCAGCISPRMIAGPVALTDTVQGTFNVPNVGESGTADVGDTIYFEQPASLETVKLVTTTAAATADMDLGHRLFWPAGEIGPMRRHAQRGWPAVCRGNATIPGLGRPADACIVDQDGDGAFDHSMFRNRDKYFPLGAPVPYATADKTTLIPAVQTVKRMLVYQGMTGNAIHIAYRESIDGLARPAFDQDFSFDLDKKGGAEIAFRGARINVDVASGTQIHFTVTQPFRDE